MVAFLTLALSALAWWGWVPRDIAANACACSDNAAWISVDWTSQPVDPVRVAALTAHAARHRLRYLYPFASYVKEDGSFSPSYAYANEFVAVFRRTNQDARLLAWIGIPLDNQGRLGIEGWVDLSDIDTRQAIVASVVDLLEQAQFDGVHLDVETVRNHDPRFVVFLSEVKDAIGSERILSISGNDWKPDALDRVPLIGNYKWSSAYYAQVAAQVDQIAAMTYDSSAPHPALYRLWMREQVRGIASALSATDVELLIGISVSLERTTTHQPGAENMESGLAGICAGLSRLRQRSHSPSGIAVYAAWEATDADWQVWREALSIHDAEQEGT